MRRSSVVSGGAAAVLLLASAGCNFTVRYEVADVAPLVAAPANLAVVELIDGRAEQGNPLVEPNRGGYAYAYFAPLPFYFGTPDWTDLRESVQAHVTRAVGLSPGAVPLPAPRDEEAAQALLDEAAAGGSEAVLFVRLHRASVGGSCALGVNIVRILAMLGGVGLAPWLIAESLPVNDEFMHGEFELLLVDPRAKAVLAQVTGRHALEDTGVTGWSHYPQRNIGPVLKQALQAGLVELASALKSPPAPRLLEAGELLRLVPEPDWIPPEGSAASSWSEGKPVQRSGQPVTHQPDATPPPEEAPAGQTAPAAEEGEQVAAPR